MPIPKGVEMMISSIVKMLGINPVDTMNAVEDIRKSVHNAASDLATLRRQNSAIMSHLGIAEPLNPELTQNEQSGTEPISGKAVNGTGAVAPR